MARQDNIGTFGSMYLKRFLPFLAVFHCIFIKVRDGHAYVGERRAPSPKPFLALSTSTQVSPAPVSNYLATGSLPSLNESLPVADPER